MRRAVYLIGMGLFFGLLGGLDTLAERRRPVGTRRDALGSQLRLDVARSLFLYGGAAAFTAGLVVAFGALLT